MKDSCCAVIVAAGNSSRMGKPKIFLPLWGKTVLEWTLEAFQRAGQVDSIVLVIRPQDQEMVSFLSGKKLQKPYKIVLGGESRQQSAANGAVAAEDSGWIAIHDGARCLITPDEIDGVISDAKKWGASALAVPVKDTIKLADKDGMVSYTPDRSLLWSMQTPQVFPLEMYRTEICKAVKEGREYTDDCQLWEYLKHPIHLYRGEYTNIKLTTEDDLAVAESVIKKRR